jgi:hypothetical protein
VLLDLHSELTAFLVLQMLKDISELKAKLTEVFSCLMTGNLIAYYAFRCKFGVNCGHRDFVPNWFCSCQV